MNPELVQKIAAGFGIFAFGFLAIGSFLNGATAVTSVVRGFEAAVIFGALAWGVGSLFKPEEEDEQHEDVAPEVSQADEKKEHSLHRAM